MITSQQISLLSELRQTPIPKATLIEMEATLQHRIHSMILNAFNKSGLSQKELATRLRVRTRVWDKPITETSRQSDSRHGKRVALCAAYWRGLRRSYVYKLRCI